MDRKKSEIVLNGLHGKFVEAGLTFTPAQLPPNRKEQQTHGQKVAARLESQQRHQEKLARRAARAHTASGTKLQGT